LDVGIKVRVRTGLHSFQEVMFNSDMRKYEGREAVIIGKDAGSLGTPTWVLDICPDWVWVEEWLDPFEEQKRKDRFESVLEGLDER
jgi:hypothetical protein